MLLFLFPLLFIIQLTFWSFLTSATPVQVFNESQSDGIGHLHPHLPPSQISPEHHYDCPACLDGRLLQHYTAKGCTPVTSNRCKCPTRFRCPLIADGYGVLTYPSSSSFLDQSSTGRLQRSASLLQRMMSNQTKPMGDCHYKQTWYQFGEIVPTEDVCRLCVCGYLPNAEIGVNCETQIECPVGRSVMADSAMATRSMAFSSVKIDCYDYYEHGQCCPRQQCVPVNVRTGRVLGQRKSCNFYGRTYQLGEKIDLIQGLDELGRQRSELPVENESSLSNELTTDLLTTTTEPNLVEELACLSCICTQSWNSSHFSVQDSIDSTNNLRFNLDGLLADQTSCRKRVCQTELDPRFRAGCIPVYQEDRCCAIDFICPRTRMLSMRIRGLDAGSKLCQFEGRKYSVGARLYQRNHSAAPCVDCECMVPPDFTCLRRKNCSEDSNNA